MSLAGKKSNKNYFLVVLAFSIIATIITRYESNNSTDNSIKGLESNLKMIRVIRYGPFSVEVPYDIRIDMMSKNELLTEMGVTNNDLLDVGIIDIRTFFLSNEDFYFIGSGYYHTILQRDLIDLQQHTRGVISDAFYALGASTSNLSYRQHSSSKANLIKVEGSTTIDNKERDVAGVGLIHTFNNDSTYVFVTYGIASDNHVVRNFVNSVSTTDSIRYGVDILFRYP